MSQFDQWRRAVVSRWKGLTQMATWLLSVVVGFVVIRPPAISPREDNAVPAQVVQLIIVVLVGVFFIFANRLNQRAHVKWWAIVSVLSLMVGVVILVAYFSYVLQHSVPYRDGRLIKGEAYLSDAIDHKARYREEVGGNITDEQLVMDFAGDTDRIWDKQERLGRWRWVAFLFTAAVPLLALCILSLLQAFYCEDRNGP